MRERITFTDEVKNHVLSEFQSNEDDLVGGPVDMNLSHVRPCPISFLTMPRRSLEMFAKTLKILQLQGNRMQNFPVALCELDLLQELNLSNNALKRIPRQIGRLKQLRELYLNDNFIEVIPQSIGDCMWLKTLDVSSNQLLWLPVEILLCQNLKNLWLDGNKFHATTVSHLDVDAPDSTTIMAATDLEKHPDMVEKLPCPVPRPLFRLSDLALQEVGPAVMENLPDFMRLYITNASSKRSYTHLKGKEPMNNPITNPLLRSSGSKISLFNDEALLFTPSPKLGRRVVEMEMESSGSPSGEASILDRLQPLDMNPSLLVNMRKYGLYFPRPILKKLNGPRSLCSRCGSPIYMTPSFAPSESTQDTEMVEDSSSAIEEEVSGNPFQPDDLSLKEPESNKRRSDATLRSSLQGYCVVANIIKCDRTVPMLHTLCSQHCRQRVLYGGWDRSVDEKNPQPTKVRSRTI